MNSYFVSITISRRQISFEYHQEGAARPLAPFPGEERWPVPLSLYCTPGRIEIGKAAERAAAHNVSGAFKEWFRHLSSGQTVKYLGQPQPVSHLLLLAAEEQFRRFLKEVRMNMDGGLENCRAAMPLVLSFEDDVDDSMRIFLVNLFRNMGYGRVIENFYNRIIATHYFSKLPAERLLIADSDGIDLTLSLYERGRNQAKCSCVIQGAGTDPRVQRVCNMIWDKTGAEYSFLSRNTEQPLLEQMALEVIGANQAEFEGIMNYSNGEQLCFMISRSELVSTGAGTKSTSSDVIRFLEKAGIAPSDVTILLRNLAAKSQPLQAAFPSSIIFDEDSKEAINQEIVKQVMPRFAGFKAEPEPMWAPVDSIGFPPPPSSSPDAQGELKEKTKKWRQVKAEAGGKSRSGQIAEALIILDRFLDECRSCIGTEALVAEIEREKTALASTTPPPPPAVVSAPARVDANAVRALERKWREVKASANGKKRGGNIDEAIRVLKSFAAEVGKVNGAENVLKSVNSELEHLESNPSQQSPSKPQSSSRPSKPAGERNAKAEHVSRPEPESGNKGEELVGQGKLKEARDWYRLQNNNTMARLLTDIIRSKKSLELRTNSIEEWIKSNNRQQIDRIKKEVEDYINLCDKAGVDSTDYKDLLNATPMSAISQSVKPAEKQPSKESGLNYDNLPIAELRKKANDGDAVAMTQLGARYLFGNGIKQNDNFATMWFKRAVEVGNGEAAFLLGRRYLNSFNTPEAAKWFRKGANLNNPEAMYQLGLLYEKGSGVVVSMNKSVKLIKSAAELGLESAKKYIHDNPFIFADTTGKTKSGQSKEQPAIIRAWADNSYHNSVNFINVMLELASWSRANRCRCEISCNNKNLITQDWSWRGCSKEELELVGFAIPAGDFASSLSKKSGEYVLTIKLFPFPKGKMVKFDVKVRLTFKIFSKDEILVL